MSDHEFCRDPAAGVDRWTMRPDGAPRPRLTLHTYGDGDGGVIVAADGEIDMSTAPLVRECLTAALSDGVHAVLVDMSAVSFLDSSGIAALVDAHRVAAAGARVLRLRNTSPLITRVLEVTGLTETFGLP
jgi:anti-sigma B factor antagonist